MSSISQLQRELSQYEALKEALKTVADNLNDANGDLNTSSTTLLNHYKVKQLVTDEETNKAIKRTKDLASKVSAKSSRITGVYIPAIDVKMEEIRKEIERLEAEEASRATRYRRWW